jgi:type IV pilus assembly protein PilV
MLKMKRKASSGGYSLIEVLVACVVLSLSILGFAGLQITGLTSNKVAMSRSQASIQAYSIIDSMRANRSAATAYVRTTGSATPSGTTRAAVDVSTWLGNLKKQLPSGDGSIAAALTDPSNPTTSTYTVTVVVQWTESRSSTPSQLSVNTQI